jgi:hypothetical protein
MFPLASYRMAELPGPRKRALRDAAEQAGQRVRRGARAGPEDLKEVRAASLTRLGEHCGNHTRLPGRALSHGGAGRRGAPGSDTQRTEARLSSYPPPLSKILRTGRLLPSIPVSSSAFPARPPQPSWRARLRMSRISMSGPNWECEILGKSSAQVCFPDVLTTADQPPATNSK